MNEGLKCVLEEMCKRVGANYNSIDFKEPGWYNKYSWTQEEEAEFIRWLADKLMTDKNIRKELLANPEHLTYGKAERAAKEFILQFGWLDKLL